MTLTSWKLAGCLAIAGMLMLPMAAEAKSKAGKAHKQTTLRVADLPQAAGAAIVAAAGNGKIHKIVKVQGTKKHAGKTYYVAQLTRGHKHATIKVTAAGHVVKHPKWHDIKAAKAGNGHMAKAA